MPIGSSQFVTIAPSQPFGISSQTQQSSANQPDGFHMQTSSNFGSRGTVTNPFLTTTVTPVFSARQNTSVTSSPFVSSTPVATAPTFSSPFNQTNMSKASVSASSPFGTSAPSPFGSVTAPFGTGATSQSPFSSTSNPVTKFGTMAPAPSSSVFGASANNNPIGHTAFGQSPSLGSGQDIFGTRSSFGSAQNALSSTSPFGGGSTTFSNNAQPFGGGQITMGGGTSSVIRPSPFGTAQNTLNIQSPFGTGLHASTNQSPFGLSSNTTPFGRSSSSASLGNKKEACKFFAQGKCNYGSNCKFSHDLPGKTGVVTNFATSSTSPFGGPGWNSPQPSANLNSAMSKNQPCKFFAQGHCKFGANCKYSHGTSGVTGFNNNVGSSFGTSQRW
jgi:hypothetical protein